MTFWERDSTSMDLLLKEKEILFSERKSLNISVSWLLLEEEEPPAEEEEEEEDGLFSRMDLFLEEVDLAVDFWVTSIERTPYLLDITCGSLSYIPPPTTSISTTSPFLSFGTVFIIQN